MTPLQTLRNSNEPKAALLRLSDEELDRVAAEEAEISLFQPPGSKEWHVDHSTIGEWNPSQSLYVAMQFMTSFLDDGKTRNVEVQFLPDNVFEVVVSWARRNPCEYDVVSHRIESRECPSLSKAITVAVVTALLDMKRQSVPEM